MEAAISPISGFDRLIDCPLDHKIDLRPTILVAEDAADTRAILNRTLEFEDYNYLQALTGEEALEKVLKHKPDIMLLDLMLPKMNGFQVLMHLRNEHISTKVCVISAIDRQDVIRQALNLGAVDYLVKPVFPEEIGQKLKALLGESEIESHFNIPCLLTGQIASDFTSQECQINRISELSLSLRTDANLHNGDIASIDCHQLSRLLHRDIPLFVRLRNMQRLPLDDHKFEFDAVFIGLSEAQREILRAEIILAIRGLSPQI